MGRAKGGPQGAVVGVDPRRLLSMTRPISRTEVHFKTESARFTPASDVPLITIWDKELTDEDYLALFAKLPETPSISSKIPSEYKLIVNSESLWVPSSPQQKQYQAHVALAKDDEGQVFFAGITSWGGSSNPHGQAKVYGGLSKRLDASLGAVNHMLDEKRRKGYQTKTQGPPYLRRHDFDQALRALAGQ